MFDTFVSFAYGHAGMIHTKREIATGRELVEYSIHSDPRHDGQFGYFPRTECKSVRAAKQAITREENRRDIECILKNYLICALWSSHDESDDSGGNPMDDNYCLSDIHPDTVDSARADIRDFWWNACVIEKLVYPGTLAEFGHDFWLTRNGHGTGFWDRGHGDIGKKLSDMAKVYGSVYLYVGDDGKIHG